MQNTFYFEDGILIKDFIGFLARILVTTTDVRMKNFELFTSIIFLIAGSSLVVCQDPCAVARRLPEAPYSRSSQRPVNLEEVYLCDSDSFTSDEWIRFDRAGMDALGYRMPEQCVNPPKCGTGSPIWMNGTHPDRLNPGPVSAFSCMRTTNKDCCGWRQPLQVKWCSPGYFAYKAVPPPGCFQSYCFDEDAPEYLFPPLSIPVLRGPFFSDGASTLASYPRQNSNVSGTAEINATVSSMGCKVKYRAGINTVDLKNKYGPPVVTVEFVVRRPDGTYEILESFDHDTFEEKEYFIDEVKLQGHIDQPILCRTTSNWARTPTIHSQQMPSAERRLEFQIINETSGSISSRVITLQEGQTFVFHLQPNFPLTYHECYLRAQLEYGDICNYAYFVKKNDKGNPNAMSAECKILFFHDVPYPDDANVGPTRITVTVEPTKGTRVKPYLTYLDIFPAKKQRYAEDILSDYKIPPMPITVVDDTPRPYCGSITDPHIRGFTKDEYSLNILHGIGDYTLARTCEPGARKLEIQAEHRPCVPDARKTVVCNCGVMIQEGNNVVGISMCDIIGYNPQIIKYQTITNDSNGNILPEPSVIQTGPEAYKITLLSGIEVLVNQWEGGNMNIEIIGLANEKYCGLCAPETDESNFEQYKVPKGDSLFKNIAKCVDEELPIGKCRCESGNLTDANIVCKADESNASFLTPKSAGVCDKPVKVTGPPNGTPFTGQINPKAIVVEDSFIMSKQVESDTILKPVNTVWPTPRTGITQAQAQAKCQRAMESSAAYALCKDQVNTASLLQMCLIDIQVTEDIKYADAYEGIFDNECLYKVESGIVLDVNGSDITDNEKLEQIKALLCSGRCAYKGTRSGTCVNGACQCYTGYKGKFCEIKIGVVPTILGFAEEVIDYKARDITTTKEILVLVSAQDVDTDAGAQPKCRFSLHTDPSPKDPVTEQTVTGVLLAGGMIACTMNVDTELINAQYRLDVSISNDAIIYSNSKSIILFDGSCMNCTTASDCSLKKDGCRVKGVCIDKNSQPGASCDVLTITESNQKETSAVDNNAATESAAEETSTNEDIDSSLTTNSTTIDATAETETGNCRLLNYDNSHSWYGKKQQGGADVTECERLCCQNSSCVALDFDSKVYYADSCWFHEDRAGDRVSTLGGQTQNFL